MVLILAAVEMCSLFVVSAFKSLLVENGEAGRSERGTFRKRALFRLWVCHDSLGAHDAQDKISKGWVWGIVNVVEGEKLQKGAKWGWERCYEKAARERAKQAPSKK